MVLGVQACHLGAECPRIFVRALEATAPIDLALARQRIHRSAHNIATDLVHGFHPLDILVRGPQAAKTSWPMPL
eukprot:3918285-Alexandrium_andersonii.AAC.1